MPVDVWLPILITAVVSILASSGFWSYVQSRDKTRRATYRLLLGLAYDKIATLGLHYIQRGWISKDEYEEFRRYLYEPYRECGGNGVGERIMEQVSQLPLRSENRYTEISRGGRH